ncbi:MAG: EamA family transporter [Candidatus Thiodiazotropha sp.]|jgi:probable blue pigment (indigoidine) exporter
MPRCSDFLLTAIAPMIWGSTYYVTTEFLPAGYPLTVAMLRALPIGLLLLLVVRKLPSGVWWWRVLLLGGLNFSIFWWMLFEAAYRLPGGIAATVGAMQPIIVVFLARFLLGTPIRILAIASAIVGLAGVAVLVITPEATLDRVGIGAGIVGAMSMALGSVLTRRWQPPVSLLTFTGWQLVAGGLLLLPAAMWFEPPLPALTPLNWIGFTYLGLIGAGLTYILWFRGLSRIEPSTVSTLGFLSPLSAVIIGWALLNQSLNSIQIAAVIAIFISLWLSQRASRPGRAVENNKPVRNLQPAAETCN